MTKVLILGNNGMLGSATEIVFKAASSIQVETTSKSGENATHHFDVFNEDLHSLMVTASPQYVINCIGLIKPRIDDADMDSVRNALHVNSLFPNRLGQIAGNLGVKVIQIATDCVYSGSKGLYSEDAPHDPLDVYGKTKSLGEISAENFLNLRVSIIGPEQGRATSLLEWFLNQPTNSQVKGFANHFWNGVSTFHFAKVALGIIENSSFKAGKLHLVPQDQISKYDLLNYFRDSFERKDIDISEVYPDEVVNRTLTSKYEMDNRILWQNAGYSEIPTVRQIVEEMSQFKVDRW